MTETHQKNMDSHHYDPLEVAIRQMKMNASNLKTMVNLAANGVNTDKILDGIVAAVTYQFKLEEKTIASLGGHFPGEHMNEHQRFLKELQRQEKDWRSHRISSNLFAESLQAKLFYHTSLFDRSLTESVKSQT